jgi:hypothetical protein
MKLHLLLAKWSHNDHHFSVKPQRLVQGLVPLTNGQSPYSPLPLGHTEGYWRILDSGLAGSRQKNIPATLQHSRNSGKKHHIAMVLPAKNGGTVVLRFKHPKMGGNASHDRPVETLVFYVSSQSSHDFGVNRGLCSTGMRQNLQVGNTSPVDSTVQWDDVERIRLCLFQDVKPLENQRNVLAYGHLLGKIIQCEAPGIRLRTKL